MYSLIEMLDQEDTVESRSAKNTILEQLQYMATSSDSAVEAMTELLLNMEPIERSSSDLRKVLQKIRTGLTEFSSVKNKIYEWIELLQA